MNLHIILHQEDEHARFLRSIDRFALIVDNILRRHELHDGTVGIITVREHIGHGIGMSREYASGTRHHNNVFSDIADRGIQYRAWREANATRAGNQHIGEYDGGVGRFTKWDHIGEGYAAFLEERMNIRGQCDQGIILLFLQELGKAIIDHLFRKGEEFPAASTEMLDELIHDRLLELREESILLQILFILKGFNMIDITHPLADDILRFL